MFDRQALLRIAPLLVAAALTVAGCTPDSARWSPSEARKENRVDFVQLTHEVHFAPGTAQLGQDEQQRLTQFLSDIGFGYGDQVTLDAGGNRDAAADTLSAKRAAAVRAALQRLRVSAAPAGRPTVAGALAQEAVVVSVGRYVVTLPVCPDWRKPQGDDYTNTPPSNFGCATMSNLGRMVANPGDLVHGTPLGPADADFVARGIQRYRSGEIGKPIKTEMPSPNSGGDGGGGQ